MYNKKKIISTTAFRVRSPSDPKAGPSGPTRNQKRLTWPWNENGLKTFDPKILVDFESENICRPDESDRTNRRVSADDRRKMLINCGRPGRRVSFAVKTFRTARVGECKQFLVQIVVKRLHLHGFLLTVFIKT